MKPRGPARQEHKRVGLQLNFLHKLSDECSRPSNSRSVSGVRRVWTSSGTLAPGTPAPDALAPSVEHLGPLPDSCSPLAPASSVGARPPALHSCVAWPLCSRLSRVRKLFSLPPSVALFLPTPNHAQSSGCSFSRSSSTVRAASFLALAGMHLWVPSKTRANDSTEPHSCLMPQSATDGSATKWNLCSSPWTALFHDHTRRNTTSVRMRVNM